MSLTSKCSLETPGGQGGEEAHQGCKDWEGWCAEKGNPNSVPVRDKSSPPANHPAVGPSSSPGHWQG